MDAWLEQFEARRQTRADEAAQVTVAGVTLTLKSGVAPQVAVRYYDAKRRLVAYYQAREEAAKKEQALPEIPDDLTDGQLLDLVDDTARALLHPSSQTGWLQLRDQGSANPLTWPDLFDLVEYLIGRASGIPTEGPTVSAGGPPSTETSSTDASLSPVEAHPV